MLDSRSRCYDCFRPRETCFCDSIPKIDNRTEVLILQHRREYFHRFNTARIVHKALANSQLLVDRTENLAKRLQFGPSAGLLYPGPAAMLLSDLPVHDRPRQLVVVDGTWHHTKTLLRDIPALQRLPRYQLAPTAPSRYRIRQEPHDQALSTVEATVAALRILEPETIGFDRLLDAFDTMVDRQLAHPGSEQGARFRARGSRTVTNIPLALHGDLANIVVAYGETVPGERGQKRVAGPPITWVARRLGDGSEFACMLTPPYSLSDANLGHLELTHADFAAALSIHEARRRWAEFQRRSDQVVAVHAGVDHLFAHIGGEQATCLQLKSVNLGALTSGTSLARLRPSADGQLSSSTPLGRSTTRLASAIEFVKHLNRVVCNRSEQHLSE